MANFLLHGVIQDVQFATKLRTLVTPVRLTLRAEGAHQQVTTGQFLANVTPHLHFPFCLALSLPALDNSHLKTSLCTLTSDHQRVCVLANSQIRFTHLPHEAGQEFTYSVLCVSNTNVVLALVTARCTIKRLDIPRQVGPAYAPGVACNVAHSVRAWRAECSGSPVLER
jgi:hypothetical protein